MADGRNGVPEQYKDAAALAALCRDRCTDGVIFIEEAPGAHFRMSFFNPDGTTGMMCGNGGRCAVAYACSLGIEPDGGHFLFEAGDGLHSASILADIDGKAMVRLGMKDVSGVQEMQDGLFIDTGARHFVLFRDDVDAVDVNAEGAQFRWDNAFAPEGTNVDFVQVFGDGSVVIRTFEKGVEAETLACGTGITAAAVACWYGGVPPHRSENGRVYYYVRAREDVLTVDFIPARPAESIFLTGPVERME